MNETKTDTDPWYYMCIGLTGSGQYFTVPKCNEKDKKNQVPVFHPRNTIQVSQASVILRWRARELARAVRPPAALLCI